MSVEAGLIAYLLADTDVSALVSTRIKPLQLAENTALPGITINRVSTSPVHKHNGKATEFRTRFQLDIWAETFSSAKALCTKVRLALDGYSGTMGAYRVDSVVLLDEVDDFEPENDNVRVIQEYELYHVE